MFSRSLAVFLAFAASASLLGGRASLSRPQQSSTQAARDCSKLRDQATDHANMDHANMDHAAHHADMKCPEPLPASPGQAAFGAIGEVVRMLKADPNTDWSHVNIEALRQHLIDMNEVTMHGAVTQRAVPGGAEMDVTGSGRTADAIKRMVVNHAKMLDQGSEYHATAQAIANGARMTITAKNGADLRAVEQIRGLGFAGLMTEGDHHAAHHMALARGESNPHDR
jgi:hypothetical protein